MMFPIMRCIEAVYEDAVGVPRADAHVGPAPVVREKVTAKTCTAVGNVLAQALCQLRHRAEGVSGRCSLERTATPTLEPASFLIGSVRVETLALERLWPAP